MTTIVTGGGENLIVEAFDGCRLRGRPDRRGHTEAWFWWSFAVEEPPEELIVELATEIPGMPALGPLGAAVSMDDGRSWRWHDAAGDGFRFRWTRPPGCDRVRFAMAPTYRLREWEAFASQRPWLRCATLCRSRRGRAVPLANCGDPSAPAVVALSARHHACESSASWVLEGLLDAWHADPALRRTAQLMVAPLMDCDGVEDGDAGKARPPHDHNRDYIDAPIHPEVAAWMEALPRLAGGRLRLGLDLHAPWIRGGWNEHIYGVGAADPAVAAGQERLLELWCRAHAGDLPLGPNRLLRAGQAWNSGTAPTCGRWYGRVAGCGLSIEFPYHGVRRDGLADLADPAALVACTPGRLRALGSSLAQAVGRWLSA